MWHYGILKSTNEYGEEEFYIGEIYTNKQGEVCAVCERGPVADSVEQLIKFLSEINPKEVIDIHNHKWAKSDWEDMLDERGYFE